MAFKPHRWKALPRDHLGVSQCEDCNAFLNSIRGAHMACDPIAAKIIEEREKPMPEGLKYDKDKTRMELFPPWAFEEVSKVLTHGAKKYGPRNWELVDRHVDRYMGAALRHIMAYQQGANLDTESNLHHLAHAACCLLFILDKAARDTVVQGELF